MTLVLLNPKPRRTFLYDANTLGVRIMRHSPKVSLILVTHNDQRTIERCLASIVTQDYPNFEIIVVDACSSDASRSIARKYAHRMIELKGNTLGTSRQAGVENSSGEVLAILDADVVLADRRWLASAVRGFDQPQVGIVWCYNEPPGNCTVIARCFFDFWRRVMTDRIRSGRASFAGSNSLYLRKAVDEVGGFDKGSHYSEDCDLALRVQGLGYKVAICPQPLIHDTMYSLSKYVRNQVWAARDFSRSGLRRRSGLSLRDIAYEHIYLSTRGFIDGVFRERRFSWLVLPLLIIIRVITYAVVFAGGLVDRVSRPADG